MTVTKDWADLRAEHYVHEIRSGRCDADCLAAQFRLERALGERDGLAESLAAIRAARVDPVDAAQEPAS